MIKGGEVVSKFVAVDQCGAEMYLKDSKKIMLKEGVYVGKTILGFWDALQNSSAIKVRFRSIINNRKQVLKMIQFLLSGNCCWRNLEGMRLLHTFFV